MRQLIGRAVEEMSLGIEKELFGVGEKAGVRSSDKSLGRIAISDGEILWDSEQQSTPFPKPFVLLLENATSGNRVSMFKFQMKN